MEQPNWDPEVRQFFLKILRSFFFGLLWLIACVYAGIYRKLGYLHSKPTIATILFYAAALVTLYFLIRYLLRTWKRNP